MQQDFDNASLAKFRPAATQVARSGREYRIPLLKIMHQFYGEICLAEECQTLAAEGLFGEDEMKNKPPLICCASSCRTGNVTFFAPDSNTWIDG